MWEARASYEDGTSVVRYFEDNGLPEQEQQYNLECWLISRHDGCVWYSVNWCDTI